MGAWCDEEDSSLTCDDFYVVVAVAVFVPILYFLFVWAFGIAPRSVLKVVAYCIRCCKRPKRWNWNKVENLIFLGSLPRWPSHLEELRSHGVGAVLTLNETWEVMMSTNVIQDDCGIAHRWLPTPDFFAPRLRDIVEAVSFIQKHVRAGTGVYVHCNGGHGRSAVCVVCYLMSEHGWTADEAFTFVKSKRKIARLKSVFGLRCQWRAVKRYARYLEFCRSNGKKAGKHGVAPAPRLELDEQPATTKPSSSTVAPNITSNFQQFEEAAHHQLRLPANPEVPTNTTGSAKSSSASSAKNEPSSAPSIFAALAQGCESEASVRADGAQPQLPHELPDPEEGGFARGSKESVHVDLP